MASSLAKRFLTGSLVLLAILCLSGVSLPADQPAVSSRDVAEIGVRIDGSKAKDEVSIRIRGCADKARLSGIAQDVGKRLGAKPGKLKYVAGDPDIISDGSIGVEFELPVIPRDEGTLPIAPFVEALAGQVSKISLVYITPGSFQYRGFENYSNKDMSLSVQAPPPGAARGDIAFYGVDVIITNPSLTSVTIPMKPAQQEESPRGLPVLPMVIIAVVVGLLIGGVLVFLLPRWKAAALNGE